MSGKAATQNHHVARVRVRRCDFNRAINCAGDENGCSSSACDSEARWTTVSHGDFTEDFGRCPDGCQQGQQSGARVSG